VRLRLLVDVRVPLLGELAVRLLDRRVARAPLDAEDLVVIADCHRTKNTGEDRAVPERLSIDQPRWRIRSMTVVRSCLDARLLPSSAVNASPRT
jgi:hypothetical protein